MATQQTPFFLSCGGEKFVLSEIGSCYLQQVKCLLVWGVCMCGMQKGVTPRAQVGPALHLAWGSPALQVSPTPEGQQKYFYFYTHTGMCAHTQHTHTATRVYTHSTHTCMHIHVHTYSSECVRAHTHTPTPTPQDVSRVANI